MQALPDKDKGAKGMMPMICNYVKPSNFDTCSKYLYKGRGCYWDFDTNTKIELSGSIDVVKGTTKIAQVTPAGVTEGVVVSNSGSGNTVMLKLTKIPESFYGSESIGACMADKVL